MGEHGEELILAFVGFRQLASLPAQFVFQSLVIGEVAEDFHKAVSSRSRKAVVTPLAQNWVPSLPDHPHVIAGPAGIGGGGLPGSGPRLHVRGVKNRATDWPDDFLAAIAQVRSELVFQLRTLRTRRDRA